MLKIVTVPSDILRQVAKPIELLDKRVLKVIEDMHKTLMAAKKPQGVGLAAPQIGESLRIFLVRPTKNGPITIFINPEIIKFSQRKVSPNTKEGVYEGCLSIPGHYAPVRRAMSVTVSYQTPSESDWRDLRAQILPKGHASTQSRQEGKLIQKTSVFSGFIAHVIQHEMDHLNGILFIDRVLEQQAKLYKVEGKDWEEVGI